MAARRTVAQIVNQAMLEIGTTQRPVTPVVNSLDQDVAQMVALLAAVAREVLMDEPYATQLGDGFWLVNASTGQKRTVTMLPVADSDIVLFDAGLAVLGLKWRFRQAKGLEFGEDLRDFASRLNKLGAKANDRVLDLDTDEERVL
jgi:hypothetical protein